MAFGDGEADRPVADAELVGCLAACHQLRRCGQFRCCGNCTSARRGSGLVVLVGCVPDREQHLVNVPFDVTAVCQPAVEVGGLREPRRRAGWQHDRRVGRVAV
jgi:hypothetical protein